MIKVACIHPQSITLLEAANQLTYTPSSKDQWYVFDPVHLYELQLSTSALSASPNNTSGMNRMISHILANLTATYTNTHVSINTDSSEWVFNNAGGAMGAMWWHTVDYHLTTVCLYTTLIMKVVCLINMNAFEDDLAWLPSALRTSGKYGGHRSSNVSSRRLKSSDESELTELRLEWQACEREPECQTLT